MASAARVAVLARQLQVQQQQTIIADLRARLARLEALLAVSKEE